MQGVDAVCVVYKAWLLGFSEGDEGLSGEKASLLGDAGRNAGLVGGNAMVLAADDALDGLVVFGQGRGDLTGFVVLIVQDADGAEGGFVLGEEDGSVDTAGTVAHVELFIQDQQGELVVVVVFVFWRSERC